MLFLLSPAKSLDYETPVPAPLRRKATEPQYLGEAAALIGVMRRQSQRQVAALMGLSDVLAALNVERYAAWRPEHTPANSRPWAASAAIERCRFRRGIAGKAACRPSMPIPSGNCATTETTASGSTAGLRATGILQIAPELGAI